MGLLLSMCVPSDTQEPCACLVFTQSWGSCLCNGVVDGSGRVGVSPPRVPEEENPPPLHLESGSARGWEVASWVLRSRAMQQEKRYHGDRQAAAG